MADDALRQRLLQLFTSELEEAVAALNAGLLRLEDAADAELGPLLADLFRSAHSIKGAAMAAGVDEATRSARELERRLAALRDGETVVDRDLLEDLLGRVDVLDRLARELRGDVRPPASAAAAARPTAPARQPAGPAPATGPPPVTGAGAATGSPHVRVPLGHVDELVGRVGELLAVAGRADALARDRPTRGAATLARDLVRISEGLAASVERLTLQSFADACAGLHRAVRDLARAGGKQARLVVDGGDVEVDRAVAALLRELLLHLVRNAVDHGIEPVAQREAAGKAPAGTVTVAAALEAGALVVRVTDDGRGADRAGLRAAVLASSDPDIGAADELELAFRSGITTAPDVTDVSGRGVGLDVVRTRLESVGGSARMTSTPGRGTTVTLTSPVTLALVRVVLVRVDDQVVGVPTRAVERMVRAPAEAPRSVGDRALAVLDGRSWPLVAVRALLGLPARAPSYLVCCRVAEQQVAIAADDLLAEREVVVKPPPPRLAGVRELLGVTVLSDGRAAAVLNPTALAAGSGGAATAAAVPEAPATPARLLVAEDSVTTRVLQQRILESAGYQVRTAVDGADAFELLRRHGADLVVSDVDMPGMDGFELCRAIRRTPELADVPVVLVTSLGSEQDRRRGVEAGADAYLVKSELQADLLLETVARLL